MSRDIRRLIIVAVIIGLTLSVLADAYYQQHLRWWTDDAMMRHLLHRNDTLPPLFANCLRIGMTLVIGAGVLAFACVIGRYPSRSWHLVFGSLFVYSTYLAIKGLGVANLTSHRMYTEMGPIAVLATTLMCVGAAPRMWQAVLRILNGTAFVTSAVVWINIGRLTTASRSEALGLLHTFVSLLLACAAIPIATLAQKGPWWRSLSWVPFLSLVVGGIVCQTRLFVLLAATLLISLYMVFPKAKSARNVIRSGAGIMCTLVLLGVAITYCIRADILPDSFQRFWDRRSEDTRTKQADNFFKRVEVEDLIMGVGIVPLGEYTAQGIDGIDLGYVNLLYYSGITGLLLFSWLHLYPAFSLARVHLRPVDAACVATVLTYSVHLMSSTTPSLHPMYYILLLTMGRCASLAGAHVLVRRKADVRGKCDVMAASTPLKESSRRRARAYQR